MLSTAERLSSVLFLPLRRLVGPLHRRRPVLRQDQNAELPPLPAPWQDPRWFRGGFPPRQHNVLRPLVHGDEYFPDLHAALLGARQRVTVAGWCLTPLMAIMRGDMETASIFADLLREVSQRAEVYVLLWSGAPALFEPDAKMVREVRQTLLHTAPRVHCALDHRASFSHDHHQKAVTVDGRIAYVGGMDVTTFQGDRWDTRHHLLRFGANWHDAQVRMEGEVVQDVEDNFLQRWAAVTGQRLEPLSPHPCEPSWNAPAQIIRTVPAGFYPFAPSGEFGIHHALTTAIRQAERFVYLENQYLWSPEIVSALVEAMNRPRSGPFRVVIVLPAKARNGKYDNDQHVRFLSGVDGGRGIFHAYSVYTGGPAIGSSGYRCLPVYVHGKISIVDDQWFSVGSANLNGRGMATDTEMNVQSTAPDIARSLRVRLWSEHLGMPEEQVAAADPIELIDLAWPEAAKEMEESLRAGALPPTSKARKYIPGTNLGSRALDVIQDITLEH